VRGVWKVFPGQPPPPDSRAKSFRRETVPVRSLWEAVCARFAPRRARPSPQRGETVQMLRVREDVSPEWIASDAYEGAFEWKLVPVRRM